MAEGGCLRIVPLSILVLLSLSFLHTFHSVVEVLRMASPESDVVVTAQPETSHIEIQSAPAKAAAPVVAQLKDGGAVPAYKIVKVRKPDGTIVKVKRPIHPTTPKTEGNLFH